MIALAACNTTDNPQDAGSNGGSGAKGGAAGTAGTTSGGKGGAAGTAPCTPCIGDSLDWGPNGGLVAFVEQSAFADCDTFRHGRFAAGDPGQSMLMCERQIPCMGSGLHGISDVLAALAQSDVKAALAEKMVLFGVDSRPVDGQVFHIERGGSVIEVGSPCGMQSGCDAIPAGVQALVDLLKAIDDEQLNLDPCRSTFQR